MTTAAAEARAIARPKPPPRARGLIARVWRNALVRALVKAVLTIYVVTTLTFFIVRLMPGNPVEIEIQNLIVQQGLSYDEARDQAAALFNIDLSAPLHLQYVDYLARLARGDLGESLLSQGQPVTAVIVRFLPWTLFTAGVGLLLSFGIGILLGLLAAYRRASWVDHAISASSSVINAIPDYILALLIVVFLGVQTRLLPITQMRGTLSPGVVPGLSLEFLTDVLFHGALPIATYVLATYGGWVLSMKASTIGALEEDYVAAARARGLSDGRIATAYVGRNAVLPLVAQLTIATGFIIGGAVFIERVFVYHGIGLLLLERIDRRDYPVIQGILLIITAAVVVANLLADVVYAKLDPRIGRAGGASER